MFKDFSLVDLPEFLDQSRNSLLRPKAGDDTMGYIGPEPANTLLEGALYTYENRALLLSRLETLPETALDPVLLGKGYINDLRVNSVLFFGGLALVYGNHQLIQERSFVPNVCSYLIRLALTTISDDFVGDFIVFGPPNPKKIYIDEEAFKGNAPYQYAKNPGLSNLDLPPSRIFYVKYERSFLRTCYILSELEKESPASVTKTILVLEDDYSEKTAMAILQGLDSVGVFSDPRFRSLIVALRDVIMRENITYAMVKSYFSYAVVNLYPEFWIDGEVKSTLKPKETFDKGDIIPDAYIDQEGITTIRLKPLSDWDAGMLELAETIRYIGSHSPHETIKRESVTASIKSGGQENIPRSEMIKSIRGELAKSKQAETDLRIMKRRLVSQYSTSFLGELMRLEGDLSGNNTLSPLVIRALANGALQSHALSTKSISWLRTYVQDNGQNEQGAYHIDYARLLQTPIWGWINKLKHAEARNNFLVALTNQPFEFTLLYRLLIAQFLQTVVLQNEDSFLFSPSYDFKDEDVQQAQNFFVQICEIFANYTRSQEEIVANVAPKAVAAIKDLYDEARIKKYRDRIHLWLTRPSLVGRRRHTPGRGLVDLQAAFCGALCGGIIWMSIPLIAYHSEKSNNLTVVANDFLSHLPPPPDFLSREALALQQPFLYGNIIHVPESASLGNGALHFFIPAQIQDYEIPNLVNSVGNLLENTFFGIPPIDFQYAPNQLVYRPEVVLETIYPPIGYRIVTVYQDGGERGFITGSGELRYPNGILPSSVAIVTEPLSFNTNPFGQGTYAGTVMYDGLVAGAYDLRHFNYEYAMSFNNALSNEPELQNLHREMVERFHGLVEQEELSSLSEVTSKAISEAVVEYSSRFWGYVQANRYYALSLNTDSQHNVDFPQFSHLETIADYGDGGYYCGYAAKSFQQFWASVGIHATYQEGAPVTSYGNELWVDRMHANNRLVLPNGQIVFIDTTPPVKDGLTPPEDLAAIASRGPHESSEAPILQQVKDLIEKQGITTIVGIVLLLGLLMNFRWLPRARVLRKMRYIIEVGKNQIHLSNIEQKVTTASVLLLGLLKADEIGALAEHASKILSLIRDTDVMGNISMINYIVDTYIPNTKLPGSAEEFLDMLEDMRENFYKHIQEEWFASGEVRATIPENLFHEAESRIKNGISLSGLSSVLDNAVELGLLTLYAKQYRLVSQVMNKITTELPDRQTDLKSKLILGEKMNLLHHMILSMLRGLDKRKRNVDYISYLYSIFS